jgi:predicted ester cyclase
MAYIRQRAPEYYEENYVAHHDPLAKGHEGPLARLETLVTAFSDVQTEILSLFAKDDTVADCFRVSANHSGPLLGIPPTGKRVSWLQNEIFKIKGEDFGRLGQH